MYKNILAPVDGSETSVLGLQHATLLAKDEDAPAGLIAAAVPRATIVNSGRL
ncbi:MAG: universal stress protein [Steroidobacteraceae bacterium]